MKDRSILPTLDAALAVATAARLDPYLTPDQVAAYLQITPAALARRRRRGGGPAFVQDGRLIRYRLSAVTDWEQSRTMVQGDTDKKTAPDGPRPTLAPSQIPPGQARATSAWVHPKQRRKQRTV